MPEINAELIRSLTPAGLLLLLVLMLVSAFMVGWIRPGRAIVEVREDRDARLADKDRQIEQWREAHRLSEEARELGAAANREQIETSKVTLELVRGIRAAVDRRQSESGGI
jgi:hypothetical protein